MTVLRAKLNAAFPEDQKVEVHVQRFDILWDFSGNAPKSVGFVGNMAVPMDPGNGDNAMYCTLEASLKGQKLRADSSSNYHQGAFDNVDGKEGTRATQACINQVIQGWLDIAAIGK